MSVSCDVLKVSASGYFNWLRRPQDIAGRPGGRHSDEALLAHIRAIQAEVKGEYGWSLSAENHWLLYAAK